MANENITIVDLFWSSPNGQVLMQELASILERVAQEENHGKSNVSAEEEVHRGRVH